MAKYVKLDDVFDLSYCTEPATMINPYGGDYVVKVEDIRKLPTIEAEPVKHGRWIYKPYENDEAVWLYHCSECNAVSASAWNYCRECGAKMEVGDG